MCMFGYITSDIDNLQVGTIYMKTYFTLIIPSQRFSHVFSAESKDKASEILTAICKGYKEGMKLPQGKEITPSKTGTQKKKEGASKQKARRDISDKKVCILPHLFCSTLVCRPPAARSTDAFSGKPAFHKKPFC